MTRKDLIKIYGKDYVGKKTIWDWLGLSNYQVLVSSPEELHRIAEILAKDKPKNRLTEEEFERLLNGDKKSRKRRRCWFKFWSKKEK